MFEAAIKPDGLADYRALGREITADNEAAEPGQMIFEWFIDDHDVHIYERYTDLAAAVSHVQRFVANFAERFPQLVHPDPDELLRRTERRAEGSDPGFNPRYLGPVAGHARG